MADHPLRYRKVRATTAQPGDLRIIAQYMFALMLRNVATRGFVFADPVNPGHFSRPGCVIASPSFPLDLPDVDQNYVYNWTRDAAITAFELVAAHLPTAPGESVESLVDYVNFADTCQTSGAPTIGHACYTVDGRPRPWSEQSDGPALQTLAILQAFAGLDSTTQATARAVINRNLDYLVQTYQNPTTNLWEETSGLSFFARATQLRCFDEVAANTMGIPVPAELPPAVVWLRERLQDHWNGTFYVSVLSPTPQLSGYDPNLDIVMASIYGAVRCTDTRLLATAGLLRAQWEDTTSSTCYPINNADAARGIGPLLGRYPGDRYDGNSTDPVFGGHPWALCTSNFAELYYTLARAIGADQKVPLDPISAPFFSQLGVDATTNWEQAVARLTAAGDRMLRAVVFHSDHLELSEQFDGTTGYEKSVADLTWSYAAFFSAVRARSAVHGPSSAATVTP